MGPPHRGGTFSPSPQSLVTAPNHSPHGSFSAGASPNTNSPTNSGADVNRITVAQVYLLLSTIKEGKNFDQQAEQLRKLVYEKGMEVFQPYLSRLVLANAPQIFPSVSRSAVANPGTYQILEEEIRKVSRELEQPKKIAEAIETANDDIFQDFDLSTFMDHFQLDALEKTILALAFKTGTRPNLKAKADAILSTNYTAFLQILSQPETNEHGSLEPAFVAAILDRYIQGPPPTFDDHAKSSMLFAIQARYPREEDLLTPPDILATIYLLYILNDQYEIATNMQQVGAAYTADEEACIKYLRKIPTTRLTEDQVGAALLYAVISCTPVFSAGVFVAALRKVVPQSFRWQQVVKQFDRLNLRITPSQFLALFNSLLPIALEDSNFDIQQLWAGVWQHPETQLSFIRAFGMQTPEQLHISTIPGFQPTFTLENYAGARQDILDRAVQAVRHPLVTTTAIAAIFDTALANAENSTNIEAKRLFQDVVLSNLDIFVVSAFTVPKPWSPIALETIQNLYQRFFWKEDDQWNFVLHSLWCRDKSWVMQCLIETHAKAPVRLPTILEHATNLQWLDELVQIISGFGLDLAALAHSHKLLDLNRWARSHGHRAGEFRQALLTFLTIKAEHEGLYQRGEPQQLASVMLPVRTVSALLNILNDISPKPPGPELILVQRTCIAVYPRLINYGQGYDEIIDANGNESNSLPLSANQRMEEHYKRMYSDEIEVRDVINALDSYKHSQSPSDQDVFACMIHGLFDEYSLYGTYPLEALATTAVLFGAIIYSKLISDLPLEIGLGMILEAVKEYRPNESMYKFGLQALMQLLGRFHEWPAFCRLLLQVPGLQGTEAWHKAEEVVRDHDEEMQRNGNGNGNSNGAIESMLLPEPTLPPFNSINVESSKYGDKYEEPSAETQEKVVFVLNNTTESNLETKFKELKDVVEEKYQGWFAGHLVEERAKMQPNYLQLYLDLLHQFNSKTLYYEVLRETYSSVKRMLNAETTMQSSTERSHLKNLAGWLGFLTLARDKPILHKNIAFKQLLIEAFDTQRLIVVIPFVCKVLVCGAHSVVFKPPNPWLMDIVHLLIELYHSAELKLNLKFEIEVLCKGLNLDHKSIEPSTDIQSRVLPVEEPMEPISMDIMDNRFENLALAGAVGSGRFSPNDIVSSVPDLGPLLTYPPPNDMVNQQGLHEIVRSAITRAVHEIISPVVERSVTIAAISTAQMIRKDFATEPDETKVRAAAISMVKRTAGSLALVTSKEPLRASMSNYIRQMQTQLNQGLPEGTILMCVNSNIDMACAQVEKKAEEKAVPEIEEMIEPELENRRQHKLLRPNDPYIDQSLSRWGMTIPNPYKLEPSTRGLNPEQMAIYEEFSRQPRIAIPSVTGQSISDANKTMPMDAFDGQFPPVSNLPTPGDSMPHLITQQHYPQRATGLANGRPSGQPMDPRLLVENIQKLLSDLVRLAAEAPEQQYEDLTHASPIIEIIDRLCQLVISSTRSEASAYTAEQICTTLFSRQLNDLTIESLVHLLGQLCKMHPSHTGTSTAGFIARQTDEQIMNVSLALALLRTDLGLLDWQRIDHATSRAILEHKEGAIEFLDSLMDRVLLNDRPSALRTDLVRSLDALGQRVAENPDLEAGRELMRKLKDSGLQLALDQTADTQFLARHDQMEYVFDEWVHLCNNPKASKAALPAMVYQIDRNRIIHGPDDSVVFYRLCIEISIERFEQIINGQGTTNDAFLWIDALGKLIARFVAYQEDGENDMVKSSKPAYLKSTLGVVVLVLNHHHVMRGENFNQKVFYRLFSTIMIELHRLSDVSFKGQGSIPPADREEQILVFAQVLLTLQPLYLPGFAYAWLSLVSHRAFLPNLMRLEDRRGWDPLVRLLECFFHHLGELLKPLHISPIARDIYRAALKLLVVLQHDFPDFLCENHLALSAAIPRHCNQLQNMILGAKPASYFNLPNPLDQSIKIDRLDEIREHPTIRVDTESILRRANLLELLIRALKSGPSEALVAPIAHAIQQKIGRSTTVGFVPVNVDVALIDSVVLFVGQYSIRRANVEGGPTFISGSPDAALLSMLAKELRQEARYYFIVAIVNQLRFPNSHTYYFSLALLDLFGMDKNDQEEVEIRQQITRVLLERLGTIDSNQPWGVLITVLELLKNPKYMFFELPFVLANPDVARQFNNFLTLTLH